MNKGTTRPPAGDGGDSAARGRLWTKALSQEFWSGVVTPLMFSIAGGLIEERMAQKGMRVAGLKALAHAPFLRHVAGQVYLNVRILDEVVRLIPSVLLTPQVTRFLPGAVRRDLVTARVPLFSLRTLRMLVRMFMIDPRWAPFWNDRAFARVVARTEGTRGSHLRVRETEMDISALLARSRALYRQMGDFLDVVVWGMVFAYVARPLTFLLAKNWGKDSSGELAARLRVGLEGVRTFEINREVESLAEEVLSDPWLNERFDRSSGGELLRGLQDQTKAENFLKRFQSFLERNGHRFHGRDIGYPTWRERPETVLEMIKMNRGSDLSRKAFALQREEREKAERELRNRIRTGLLGPLKEALFARVLSYDQRYFVLRENMRYYADIYLEQFRRLYLEIGRRWQSQGAIERSEDIVFLSREEIEEACGKGIPVRQTVEQRRSEFERYRHLRTPEVIGDGEDVPFSSWPAEGETFALTGEVASPGRVHGPARIVHRPEDLLGFRKGDILVAQYTDPSWTPVLSLAAGLVLEVGGLLSHGAIVAREYGIPALIQVEGAVEKIGTGDRIELDTERRCVRVTRGTPVHLTGDRKSFTNH